MLNFSGAIVDAKNHLKLTPLFNAAAEGHLEVVKLLLEHGKCLFHMLLNVV